MTAEDADRETIARLADDVVPVLISRLAASELGEIEVREQGWRIRLRRTSGADTQPGASGHAAQGAPAAHRPAAIAAPSGHSAESHPTGREPERGLIVSPAVGYFAARDGVGQGASLRRGDIVGHVDVLGVRQEVVVPADGALASFEVESGQAVEYGQPIARMAISAAARAADV